MPSGQTTNRFEWADKKTTLYSTYMKNNSEIDLSFADFEYLHLHLKRSKSVVGISVLTPFKKFTRSKSRWSPAMVALSVEHLLHKKCHLLTVDRIPLGAYAWYCIINLVTILMLKKAFRKQKTLEI